MTAPLLAIHGGAGVIERDQMTAEQEKACVDALERIAAEAYASLIDGADAVAAVEFAVRGLEDCPFFNAGYGGVLNANGDVEMDAALMSGSGRHAGAVAAIRNVRHPVSVARRIMDATQHVMLAGDAAWTFARDQGLELAPEGALVLEDRKKQLANAKRTGGVSLDHDGANEAAKMGTVGAVARDATGALAAATSTGGMTNKIPGRVGDSPLIGCGTWADNDTCAVSTTGEGEYFIRGAVAYDVHARMCYARFTVEEACAAALAEVTEMGGSGGLIAITADGHIALPFTTPGMYRAWVGADGEPHTAIYRE